MSKNWKLCNARVIGRITLLCIAGFANLANAEGGIAGTASHSLPTQKLLRRKHLYFLSKTGLGLPVEPRVLQRFIVQRQSLLYLPLPLVNLPQ